MRDDFKKLYINVLLWKEAFSTPSSKTWWFHGRCNNHSKTPNWWAQGALSAGSCTGCLIVLFPLLGKGRVNPLIISTIVSFRPWRSALTMLRFGQHLIKPSVVFLRTELCFALVNRRPVVPGRILPVPPLPAKGRARSGHLEGQVGCDMGLFQIQAVMLDQKMLDQCCRTAENSCLATVTFEVKFYWPFHHWRYINNQVLLKAF